MKSSKINNKEESENNYRKRKDCILYSKSRRENVNLFHKSLINRLLIRFLLQKINNQ